jgi:NAD-dependent dihydropyrimidine dehydrogenase PreA subunit
MPAGAGAAARQPRRRGESGSAQAFIEASADRACRSGAPNVQFRSRRWPVRQARAQFTRGLGATPGAHQLSLRIRLRRPGCAARLICRRCGPRGLGHRHAGGAAVSLPDGRRLSRQRNFTVLVHAYTCASCGCRTIRCPTLLSRRAVSRRSFIQDEVTPAATWQPQLAASHWRIRRRRAYRATAIPAPSIASLEAGGAARAAASHVLQLLGDRKRARAS